MYRSKEEMISTDINSNIVLSSELICNVHGINLGASNFGNIAYSQSSHCNGNNKRVTMFIKEGRFFRRIKI